MQESEGGSIWHLQQNLLIQNCHALFMLSLERMSILTSYSISALFYCLFKPDLFVCFFLSAFQGYCPLNVLTSIFFFVLKSIQFSLRVFLNGFFFAGGGWHWIIVSYFFSFAAANIINQLQNLPHNHAVTILCLLKIKGMMSSLCSQGSCNH